MMGTLDCVYETPCGWCSKFDKECEKKKKKREKSYIKCVFYSNGKCIGTKELDPCLQGKCDHMKF